MSVRLGLFFAFSLRYLAHTLCRLRIKMGRVEDWHVFKDRLRAGDVYWRPLFGGGVSFRELREASGDRIDITWLDTQPTHAQVSTLAPCFLFKYEKSLVTLDLAVDVMACVEPGAPGGMFGYMLYYTGHIDPQRPDVPRNGRLARAIADVGWGEFRRQLAYKGEAAGVPVTVVSRWYPSSKTCSGCGAVKNDLTLKDRVYECASCRLIVDRDFNTAVNLERYPGLSGKSDACGHLSAGLVVVAARCNSGG